MSRPQPTIKWCPQCGAMQPPDRLSCARCGAELPGAPEQEGQAAPLSNRDILLMVAFVLTILVGIVLLGALCVLLINWAL